MKDEKFKGKFTEEETKKTTEKLDEITKWFESNTDAEFSVYEAK